MQNAAHILLVHKANHEEAFLLASRILSYLRENGHTSAMIGAGCDNPAYDDAQLALVIVLGGDGTMLGVARRLVGRGVPLLGINFGRVGFLTDAQPEFWQQKITDFLSGLSSIRTCAALGWTVKRADSVVASGAAINDVVLSRGSLSRLVCINMSVNGNLMGMIRGDGVIAATPLGSSAYSVSAGGPLVYPGLEVILFTPICPFIHTIPPMVFPGDAILTLQVLHESTECYITVDGQEGQHLQVGDVVEVSSLPNSFHFLCDKTAFIGRLRARCMGYK
jgi:NAD+ kinase